MLQLLPAIMHLADVLVRVICPQRLVLVTEAELREGHVQQQRIPVLLHVPAHARMHVHTGLSILHSCWGKGREQHMHTHAHALSVIHALACTRVRTHTHIIHTFQSNLGKATTTAAAWTQRRALLALPASRAHACVALTCSTP